MYVNNNENGLGKAADRRDQSRHKLGFYIFYSSTVCKLLVKKTHKLISVLHIVCYINL